ncbi:hypothetical protein D5S18_23585 [Nocardia panacis]|uniref:Uncharacterized protein n=1 Tax=Nocardia panacis TaxID=2340916 RepID=A0A3A4KDM2_9NOCA|nr:hypothetical protein D5S18_23585 [Nocardia panacis]
MDGLAALSGITEKLTPLASGITQAVSQGVTALGGVIKDGVEKSIEQVQKVLETAQQNALAPHPDQPALPKAAAEFDIAGKHLKFEMSPDGQVGLAVSGPDGQTQQFKVKLDEHGIPVISTENHDGEPKPADQPPHGPPDKSGSQQPQGGSPDKSGGQQSQGSPDRSNNQQPHGSAEKAGGQPPHGPVEKPGSNHSPAPAEAPKDPTVPTVPRPSGKQQQEGEHRPQPKPAGTGGPPVDSGAQLAEAGPL